MANGRVIVPPPAFTPISHGLLSVSQDLTGQFSPRWEAGIIYQPMCSDVDSTYGDCLVVTGVGAVPAAPAKSATYVNVRRASTPFTVYARKDCAAPTFWDQAPAEIREALTQGEEWQVERTFWTGTSATATGVTHPHLAANATLSQDNDLLQPAATVVAGGPFNIVEGLGYLEEALADCYKGQGVIHIPAAVAPHLTAWGLLHITPEGQYITCNGNLAAIGRGYTGSAPDGTSSAAHRWLYATGATFYARSEPRAFTRVEMFDRLNNTVEALAERTYVVGWDCCLLGLSIDLSATISG